MLAKIYGAVISLRNYFYDENLFQVHDLGARTISVGNITTGGTGKTPLVAYIASHLAERGEKVCILTRGYGREDEGRRVLVSDGHHVLVDAAHGGDEPVELARKLLGKAIVIADADRVAAAEWASRKFGLTAFVLDDAFQHRKAKRDLDIVCIDATDPFGGDKLLPAGKLRESQASLARADILVITRVEQAGDISDLRSQISDLAPAAAVFESRTVISRIGSLDGRNFDASQPVFAFCGLGNPQSFFSLLESSDWRLAGTRALRDHHVYTQGDIDEINGEASKNGATVLVTTGKDAVKLVGLKFELPVHIAEIDIRLDRESDFAELI
ncbi:MAG TPA: tetraacyldisaccharide 4'-kinase [Pyrinomonadaceae bacterium]|nr:tetraacyldisaccharide 4'-kinase [Pyrinomonadaceae bacterium]